LSTSLSAPARIRSAVSHPGAGVVIAFAVLVIFLSIVTPRFMTLDNIVVVLRQSVVVGVMAIGMTFVIGMGGIDLSVGAILGITGVATAAMIQDGVNIYLAIIAGPALGLVIGLLNGLLITIFKLPPFIATLGTMSLLRGLIYVFTQGIPIYGLRYPEFQFVGQGFLWIVPFPVVVFAILVAVFSYVLYRTRLGRYTLSIGSNPTAARLVGIGVSRTKVVVYAISGLLCGVAGVILTSRSEAAAPDAGLGVELDVIAATIIGGTAMTGGRAVMFGTVIGAVLMTTIRNGLNLLGVSPLWHQVVIGAFIIAAVAASSWSKNRSAED